MGKRQDTFMREIDHVQWKNIKKRLLIRRNILHFAALVAIVRMVKPKIRQK